MNSIFYDFKKYKHRDYKDKNSLHYVYIHLWGNKPLYIGKGSKGRCGDFANRSLAYKEYINEVKKENIQKYILAESYDEKLMIQLERIIHEFILDSGYNLFSKPQTGNYGCLKGRTFSNETKVKLSNGRKGKKHTQETKNKIGNARKGAKSILRRSIVQLELDGTFIKEYDNIRELDNYGFHNSAIVMCCKGNRNKHKGFKWMYSEGYYNIVG